MATLYEYFNTGDDSYVQIYGVRYSAQTFTPLINHTVTSVRIKAYTPGNAGTIYVSVRATDVVTGHPTGPDLCSGSIDQGDFISGPPGSWASISQGAGAPLTAGVKYAKVVRAPSGYSGNYIAWRLRSAGGYPRGDVEYTDNGGVLWTTQPWDHMFEEWGDPIVAPTVTTNPASSILAGEADINGTLDDDGGEACDCGFEWGETVAYGNTTPTQSRTTGQTFAQTISGLDPGTTYHFRAFATNGAGTSYGADRTFTAIETATATTDPATGIGMVVADLNGTLDDDGGEACDCGFEWGETVAYGNTTPTQSRTTGQTFAQTISGLDPGTTYHFRAIATNVAGTSYGADRTFETPVAIPTVTTDPASALSTIAATPNGTLDADGGEACDCGFEWGLDTGYGTTTPTESKTTGETFSQVIGGLSHSTTYHFRAIATNSVGTGYGADRTFATALLINKAYALARREL